MNTCNVVTRPGRARGTILRRLCKAWLILKIVSLALLRAGEAWAQEAAAGATMPLAAGGPPAAQDLAKKLANPVANLVSIPFQFNWIEGVGPQHDLQYVVNVQPVVPFSISPKWNLVARWIMPYVSQPASFGSSTGGSDIVASAFLSPREGGRWLWGVGPVVSLPTASDPTLGSGKWSAGPTAVVLKQSGGMTYVFLANQVWSFANTSDVDRREINRGFFEPVISHSSKSGVSVTLMSETSVDWLARNDRDKWTVPVTLQVGKITRLGPFPFSVAGGGGAYLAKPDNGPDWQMRTVFTLILPPARPGGRS